MYILRLESHSPGITLPPVFRRTENSDYDVHLETRNRPSNILGEGQGLPIRPICYRARCDRAAEGAYFIADYWVPLPRQSRSVRVAKTGLSRTVDFSASNDWLQNIDLTVSAKNSCVRFKDTWCNLAGYQRRYLAIFEVYLPFKEEQ